ncbi:hypothetical protein AX279_17245 [Pseudomonas sp. J237]|nr:hypothetical protein AX279_17245 [Pseudomonas sp. J237]
MSGLALIPVAQIEALQDDVIVQGGRNKRAMFDAAPWLADLDQEVFSAAQQPACEVQSAEEVGRPGISCGRTPCRLP